jgi:hypothetical protein
MGERVMCDMVRRGVSQKLFSSRKVNFFQDEVREEENAVYMSSR